ncbi:hypothetical protein IWQ60_003675 [Tieghemiomyces parasiticus]|uniref:G-protein coupled receptors family 3 profile domain-containing protein n=1 Tax=Tieghemiomyces parasiticus TaxID=78921 RepID=A0A9W8ACU8_9FUNG|nr:hypothetical protein IWQ60_003675 [Tieghemiomyces parasiticus]
MPYLPLSRASCIIYEAWLMYFCGLHLYLIVVNYRIWILYWLLIRMRPIGGRAFYGVFACLCIPAILFPVLSTAIPGWVTASEGDRKGNCRYTVAYHIYFSFALYYLVAVAVVLSVLLRNVRKTFNEYRESMISTAGFVILAIVTGVTGSQYIFLHGWGRFIILTLSLVTVNLYFWISLSRPLYGYLFDRQNYLARFQETLAMDGLTGLQSSGGGTASRSEATAVKASVTGTETPAEAIEAEPAKEFSVYQNSVSDAELTNVRSLFAPSKPLDEKAYLV